MPNLTLTEVFGSGAVFDGTAGTLTINLEGLNWGTIDPVIEAYTIDNTNIDDNVGRILWAIISRLRILQPENNNDDERSLYIISQGKRSAIRNNVAQFQFQLVVNGYANDPFGSEVFSGDLVPGTLDTNATQDGAGGS
ncbi:MAG: hypothetical protein AB4368_22135 [Xenococcaceae cyanobacterium]